MTTYLKAGWARATGYGTGSTVATLGKRGWGRVQPRGAGESPQTGGPPTLLIEAELAANNWVDVTERLRAMATSRGRQQELDRVEAGTASFTLANRDRALDPTNTGGTVNLIPNPGFQVDTTGWTDNSCTLTRWAARLGHPDEPDDRPPGIAGNILGKVAITGASSRIDAGNWTLEQGVTYTVSIYVWIPAAFAGTYVRLYTAGTFAGATETDPVQTNARSDWQRLSFQLTPAADVSGLALAVTTDAFTVADVYYVACAQIEKAPAPSQYCDGYQPGCYWDGTPNASTSGRIGILPMRRIRASASHRGVSYPLHSGYSERWPPVRRGPADAEVTVDCVDRMANLAVVDLHDFYGYALSGERIRQALLNVGWGPASGGGEGNTAVNLDAGQSQVADADFTTSGSGPISCLQHVQDVADSELGMIFVDGAGVFTFHDRHRRLDAAHLEPIAVFGDDPDAGEFPYVDLRPSFDVANIYNQVSVTIPTDTMPATAEDADSSALPPDGFGPRSLDRDTQLYDWDDAQDQANYLLYRHKDARLQFDALVLKGSDFRIGDVSMWEHILGRELSDRIRVVHRPPGGGDPIIQDCHIEGISHEFSGHDWKTTWLLSPALSLGWVLDDPTNSVLDSGTVVCY